MFFTAWVTGNTTTFMYVYPCGATNQTIHGISNIMANILESLMGIPSVFAKKSIVGWFFSYMMVNHVHMTYQKSVTLSSPKLK